MKYRLVLYIALFATVSYAWPPTIGPELSFQNASTKQSLDLRNGFHGMATVLTLGVYNLMAKDPQIPNKNGEHLDAIAYKGEVLKICPECQVETIPGKFRLDNYKVTFPNGFWMVISVDPGVVELQTQPRSLEDYRTIADFVQNHIYTPAKQLEFAPNENDGHTNIGALSAFSTVEQMAEFLLDQVNHPELGLGVLGQDLHNAPPLALLHLEQKSKFFSLMDEVKQGKITSHKELALRLNKEVYYRSKDFNDPKKAAHYQAISVKRLAKAEFPEQDAPIEIRYTNARDNFNLVLLNYELFIKRIEYLNKRKTFSNLQHQNTFLRTVNMSPSEKLSRFYVFLAEMGESLEKYSPLISDLEIRVAPLDAFVKGAIDWLNPQSHQEILRYLPDLETSDWVQARFEEILSEPSTPPDFRQDVLTKMEKRSHAAHPENRIMIERFLKNHQQPDTGEPKFSRHTESDLLINRNSCPLNKL